MILRVKNFQLDESSERIFETLKKIPETENLKMIKMIKDVEEHGRIRIDEWYEIIGGLKIPNASKAFWVFSKDTDVKEPYNFFMRVDIQTTAENYDTARVKVKNWVEKTFAQPLKEVFEIENLEIQTPTELSSFITRRRS